MLGVGVDQFFFNSSIQNGDNHNEDLPTKICCLSFILYQSCVY